MSIVDESDLMEKFIGAKKWSKIQKMTYFKNLLFPKKNLCQKSDFYIVCGSNIPKMNL